MTRTPIAMVDETGFVLPYIISSDDKLPVRYIYSEKELELHLQLQRTSEETRHIETVGELQPTEAEIERASVEITEDNVDQHTLDRNKTLAELMSR